LAVGIKVEAAKKTVSEGNSPQPDMVEGAPKKIG